MCAVGLLQYTQSNLAFALTVEPKNEALLKKMEWVQHQRKEKKATVPSTIGDELEFNPFMRVDKEALQVLYTFLQSYTKLPLTSVILLIEKFGSISPDFLAHHINNRSKRPV